MLRFLLLSLFSLLSVAADISSFGGYPDGTDTTPALNAAVSALSTGPDRTVHFNAGNYRFNSQPSTFINGLKLVGEGKASTVLMVYYPGSFITVRGNGTAIRDVTIYANGVAATTAIRMVADEAQAGGNHDITNVWITGTGTWALPLFLDGSARISAPEGLRAVMLNNVDVFNGTWWAVEWWNCVACEWFGGGVYQGFGTTQAIVVGGSLSTRNYINANIDWAASTIWSGAMR